MPLLSVRNRSIRSTLTFESLLVMVLAAAVALIAGLLAGFQWGMVLTMMLAVAILIGALFFSVMAMRHTGHPLDEVAEWGPEGVPGVTMEALREAERLNPKDEPYIHHEQHVESPGDTFAELTTRLPSSTPFLAELECRNLAHAKRENKR